MSDDEFAPIAGTYPPVIRLYASLFPELSRFADRSERRVAWRRATSEATSRPSFWLAALVLIALDATVVFSLPPLGVPISQRANVRLLSLIVAMGALFVLMWLCRRSIQRCLRRQLNEIGTPTCVGFAGCTFAITVLSLLWSVATPSWVAVLLEKRVTQLLVATALFFLFFGVIVIFGIP